MDLLSHKLNDDCYIDITEDINNMILINGELEDNYSLAMNKLKDRDRQIIEDRFIIGKTQMEIANELGISQAQISRIEKNAIKSLKKSIR